ncbi:hypothetical protein [Vibrio owensii]|uniref:hypothetical protein n=1 Tax=Vibrio owensii TaxID=696485 RepID=UPI003CC6C7B6
MFNFDNKTVFVDTREDAKKAVEILVQGQYLEETSKKDWPLVVAKATGGFDSEIRIRRNSEDMIVEEQELMITPEGNVDAKEISFAFSCARTQKYFDQHLEWHVNPSEDEIASDEEVSENLWAIYEKALEENIPVEFIKTEGKLPIKLGNMTIEADFRSVFKDAVIRNINGEEVFRIHDYMNLSVKALSDIMENMMEPKETEEGDRMSLTDVISTLGELGMSAGVITIVELAPANPLADAVYNSLTAHTKNSVIAALSELKIEGDWATIADKMIEEWTAEGKWTQAA